VKLTPEDQRKLQDKELANIIRKLNAGKTLTAREEAKLAAASAAGHGADETQTPGNAAPATGYAKTWDELATACHVDRRTLTNLRSACAKELKTRLKEWLRADGRKDIAWWIRFLDDQGVKGRGANNPEIDFESERALRLREWRLKLDRAEFELGKSKELMLEVAEFEAALGVMLARFRAALNALPGRAAGKMLPRARAAILVSMKARVTPTVFKKVEAALGQDSAIDFADIEEVLSAEIDLVLRTLEACDYLVAREEPVAG
jgi:hypothetical protein